ncbi:MAG: DUF1272 domain-containing protein [Reichenbachiella sp.]|uniref:DUF1272 domain-containing protein n=1 Tax=Reichenbachiella sp. TaxID=2184521 RepID=UPI00329774E3
MLSLRPTCENCNKSLPPNSKEAMICSYECTFCSDCVKEVLHNVCPNCGGGFENRPIRPSAGLKKHPASQEVVFKPVHQATFQPLMGKNQNIRPEER